LTLTIRPNTLRGHIEAPSGKSALHRSLICAALSDDVTELRCGTLCADVLATVGCLRALGAEITVRDDGLTVVPITAPPKQAVLDCGESGSTLRFLLPVAAALGVDTVFRMSGRLGQRPVAPLLDVLRDNGCVVTSVPEELHLSGRLQAGNFRVDASASSQFLSGLLLALPLLQGSSVSAAGEITSRNYVNFTMDTMKSFGITCTENDGNYCVRGTYRSPGRFCAEGDWSAAAYWLAANALGGAVTVAGLTDNSIQGDRAAAALLALIRRGGAVIDCGSVPDLLPPLAAVAAITPGETRFRNAGRLRDKESDRLQAVSTVINAMGGDCRETADGLIFQGVSGLHGAELDCFGDHRIAMMAAIAATAATGDIRLHGAECVAKSYPDFWRDYQTLGGYISES